MVKGRIGHAAGSVLRDIRYAARALARTPGFALTVVLTLAVTIGASGAVFSAIDNVLLRPLPFPDAARLAYVHHTDEASSVGVDIPPVRLLDWDERNESFDALAAYYTEDVTDTTGDRPLNVRRATVTPGFLDVWGIPPAIGRGFNEAEHRLGGQFAALLSDRYWRSRLDADPDVLTRTLEIDGQTHSIIGVMPPAFASVDDAVDLWTPHPVDAPWTLSRQGGWFTGVAGRLRPGVELDQARADLNVVQSRLAAEYPETDRNLTVYAVPYKDSVVGALSGSLSLLFGAVTVLLLIACTNIAALLLARAAQRERDTAIRYSLGASRTTVARHLLAESALLVLAGALAGLFVAYAAVKAMTVFAADLPRFDELGIDGRMVAYMAVSAVVVMLLCGLLPAFRSAGGAGSAFLGSRSEVSSRHSLNWLLVGVQVALSVTLLAGAGLLLRSFDALSRVDPGFDPAHVLAFRLSGSFAETNDYPALVQRISRTLDDLTALPGIEAAATSFTVPAVSERNQNEVALVESEGDPDSRVLAETRTVSPTYFETMQIPVVSGALCRQPEGQATEVMVNRSFAERYFPDRSLIGLRLASDSPDRIAGIVGDARELGINREPVPTVYYCFNAPSPFPWFFVRTGGAPESVTESVRARLNELEPLRSVYEMAPLARRIGDLYAEDRLRTILLTSFSLAALSLTCLGIYGTLSYIVSLRRREVGLRMALGARQNNIVRRFLAKALGVAGAACVVGLVMSMLLTGRLSGMLYGVSPSDPITLAGVVAMVLLVASAAALVPAMRASRLDPMEALREE